MNKIIQYIGAPNQIDQVFNFLKKRAYILSENGTKLTLELAEFKNKRTKAQNDFYWVTCESVAKFLRRACPSYITYTKDLIHDLNKKKFDIDTTTGLSIKEFCEYMNEVIEYWIDKTGKNWTPEESPEEYLKNRGYMETQN